MAQVSEDYEGDIRSIELTTPRPDTIVLSEDKLAWIAEHYGGYNYQACIEALTAGLDILMSLTPSQLEWIKDHYDNDKVEAIQDGLTGLILA